MGGKTSEASILQTSRKHYYKFPNLSANRKQMPSTTDGNNYV